VSLEPGVPVYELTNTENQGRYKIYKEVFSDPYRNVIVQKIRFEPLEGKLADYRLYALLAPHLANCGAGNTGWIGDYKGVPMLFAEHKDRALAFACSAPWKKMSVGFAGTSDGWQDLSQHYQMTWEYTRAENGNIALTGEIDLAACGGEFVLALGFGGMWSEAGQQARSTLLEAYEDLRDHYVWHWKQWQDTLLKLDGRPYWGGMQMDETAFPILLVDMLQREAKYALGDLQRWWKLVERAARFIVRNGPVTQQDRWEEDAGYSPFTLAVEIAGLLAA